MLEGEIKQIDLVQRLIQLWRERFTGAIRFENDGVIKIIYLKEGDILSASTNDRADSVDEILMRAGKVSKEHVKQALAKRKENETLGDALLNLGFITRKELTWARRIQVINVIRSIEAWSAGSFTIVADYLPKREEGTLYPLPQIIVEMIVTDADKARFERLLESGAAVFEKTAGEEETFRKLGLNEDAEAVMAQVDGEKSASEVAAASRQDSFNAFKLLHALSLLGVVRRAGAPAAVAPAATGFEGVAVADAADAWGVSAPDAQVTLDDQPGSPSFNLEDDLQPVPGLADPSGYSSPPSMPAWEEPPRAASPLVAPSPEPPAEPEEEPRWGFDEAQIEASQAVITPAAPPPPPPPADLPRRTSSDEGTMTTRRVQRPSGEATMTRRPAVGSPPARKEGGGRFGLLLTLMLIFILAGVGYFGYIWWQGREANAPQAAAATTTAPAATSEAPTPTATATAAPVTTTLVPVPSPPTVATTTTQAPVTPTAARPPAPPRKTAPPATGDRARYDEMARNYAQNPSGNFTVQFAIVCEPSNVTRALGSSGGGSVWFTPIVLKERSCYRMFWGRFETREEAESAMGRLPGELRESKPAVVSVPR